MVFLLILWSARYCWWCWASFFKLRVICMNNPSWWAEAGLCPPLPPSPHRPSCPCKLLPCQPTCFRLKQLFWWGQKTISQKALPREIMVEWFLELPVSTLKHYRHKQWSSQWLQCCTGSNKSVLYFFVLVGEGRERGWRGLVMEECILFPLLYYFKKNGCWKRDGIQPDECFLTVGSYKTLSDQKGVV